MIEKNKLDQKTTLFLSEKTMSFYKDISETNQQKLAWITRKVLDNYVEFCRVNNLSNDSYKEIDQNLKSIFAKNLEQNKIDFSKMEVGQNPFEQNFDNV